MYLLDLKQPSCKHSWAVPGCFAMLDFKFSSVALQRFSSRLPRPYQLIFFSSTIRGKFCGIHLLLFARPFVTAVLSLCSVVAVISKHSRTVFKYNHALVLRVYCHRSSGSVKACIGGHQIFVSKQGFLGTMKSSGPCFVRGLPPTHCYSLKIPSTCFPLF